MRKILEGVTIETLPEAIKQADIQPGQRFSIVVDDQQPARPKLADVAARMRATAAARGMATEIFDAILAQNG
ncbi:MAG TPA: hypothetical protein VKZ79_17435 [Alphaproteobacteria bacterium]|nr:hypothetical protein [Alphaproteobacteria bacterium]